MRRYGGSSYLSSSTGDTGYRSASLLTRDSDRRNSVFSSELYTRSTTSGLSTHPALSLRTDRIQENRVRSSITTSASPLRGSTRYSSNNYTSTGTARFNEDAHKTVYSSHYASSHIATSGSLALTGLKSWRSNESARESVYTTSGSRYSATPKATYEMTTPVSQRVTTTARPSALTNVSNTRLGLPQPKSWESWKHSTTTRSPSRTRDTTPLAGTTRSRIFSPSRATTPTYSNLDAELAPRSRYTDLGSRRYSSATATATNTYMYQASGISGTTSSSRTTNATSAAAKDSVTMTKVVTSLTAQAGRLVSGTSRSIDRSSHCERTVTRAPRRLPLANETSDDYDTNASSEEDAKTSQAYRKPRHRSRFAGKGSSDGTRQRPAIMGSKATLSSSGSCRKDNSSSDSEAEDSVAAKIRKRKRRLQRSKMFLQEQQKESQWKSCSTKEYAKPTPKVTHSEQLVPQLSQAWHINDGKPCTDKQDHPVRSAAATNPQQNVEYKTAAVVARMPTSHTSKDELKDLPDKLRWSIQELHDIANMKSVRQTKQNLELTSLPDINQAVNSSTAKFEKTQDTADETELRGTRNIIDAFESGQIWKTKRPEPVRDPLLPPTDLDIVLKDLASVEYSADMSQQKAAQKDLSPVHMETSPLPAEKSRVLDSKMYEIKSNQIEIKMNQTTKTSDMRLDVVKQPMRNSIEATEIRILYPVNHPANSGSHMATTRAITMLKPLSTSTKLSAPLAALEQQKPTPMPRMSKLSKQLENFDLSGINFTAVDVQLRELLSLGAELDRLRWDKPKELTPNSPRFILSGATKVMDDNRVLEKNPVLPLWRTDGTDNYLRNFHCALEAKHEPLINLRGSIYSTQTKPEASPSTSSTRNALVENRWSMPAQLVVSQALSIPAKPRKLEPVSKFQDIMTDLEQMCDALKAQCGSVAGSEASFHTTATHTKRSQSGTWPKEKQPVAKEADEDDLFERAYPPRDSTMSEQRLQYTAKWLQGGDLKSFASDSKPDLLKFAGPPPKISVDQLSIGSCSAEIAAITGPAPKSPYAPDLLPDDCCRRSSVSYHTQPTRLGENAVLHEPVFGKIQAGNRQSPATISWNRSCSSSARASPVPPPRTCSLGWVRNSVDKLEKCSENEQPKGERRSATRKASLTDHMAEFAKRFDPHVRTRSDDEMRSDILHLSKKGYRTSTCSLPTAQHNDGGRSSYRLHRPESWQKVASDASSVYSDAQSSLSGSKTISAAGTRTTSIVYAGGATTSAKRAILAAHPPAQAVKLDLADDVENMIAELRLNTDAACAARQQFPLELPEVSVIPPTSAMFPVKKHTPLSGPTYIDKLVPITIAPPTTFHQAFQKSGTNTPNSASRSPLRSSSSQPPKSPTLEGLFSNLQGTPVRTNSVKSSSPFLHPSTTHATATASKQAESIKIGTPTSPEIVPSVMRVPVAESSALEIPWVRRSQENLHHSSTAVATLDKSSGLLMKNVSLEHKMKEQEALIAAENHQAIKQRKSSESPTDKKQVALKIPAVVCETSVKIASQPEERGPYNNQTASAVSERQRTPSNLETGSNVQYSVRVTTHEQAKTDPVSPAPENIMDIQQIATTPVTHVPTRAKVDALYDVPNVAISLRKNTEAASAKKPHYDIPPSTSQSLVPPTDGAAGRTHQSHINDQKLSNDQLPNATCAMETQATKLESVVESNQAVPTKTVSMKDIEHRLQTKKASAPGQQTEPDNRRKAIVIPHFSEDTLKPSTVMGTSKALKKVENALAMLDDIHLHQTHNQSAAIQGRRQSTATKDDKVPKTTQTNARRKSDASLAPTVERQAPSRNTSATIRRSHSETDDQAHTIKIHNVIVKKGAQKATKNPLKTLIDKFKPKEDIGSKLAPTSEQKPTQKLRKGKQ